MNNPPPHQNADSGPGGAVKRDMLQSKTVTFKPAYRDDTMRPGEFAKPTVKPGLPNEPDNR